jgi:hypothetical protein
MCTILSRVEVAVTKDLKARVNNSLSPSRLQGICATLTSEVYFEMELKIPVETVFSLRNTPP